MSNFVSSVVNSAFSSKPVAEPVLRSAPRQSALRKSAPPKSAEPLDYKKICEKYITIINTDRNNVIEEKNKIIDEANKTSQEVTDDAIEKITELKKMIIEQYAEINWLKERLKQRHGGKKYSKRSKRLLQKSKKLRKTSKK